MANDSFKASSCHPLCWAANKQLVVVVASVRFFGSRAGNIVQKTSCCRWQARFQSFGRVITIFITTNKIKISFTINKRLKNVFFIKYISNICVKVDGLPASRNLRRVHLNFFWPG